MEDSRGAEKALQRRRHHDNAQARSEYKRKYYEKNREKLLNKAKDDHHKKVGGQNPRGRPRKYALPIEQSDHEINCESYIKSQNIDGGSIKCQAELASSCSEHGPLMIDSNSESQSDNPEICSQASAQDQPRSDGV